MAVELPSTTESFWSVLTVKVTGKSEIHGDLDGENKDTSDLALETLAEFAKWPHSPMPDMII